MNVVAQKWTYRTKLKEANKQQAWVFKKLNPNMLIEIQDLQRLKIRDRVDR